MSKYQVVLTVNRLKMEIKVFEYDSYSKAFSKYMRNILLGEIVMMNQYVENERGSYYQQIF